MSFFKPEDLVLTKPYKLTEFVDGQKISGGNNSYTLMEKDTEARPGSKYPVLRFRQGNHPDGDVFLTEAHAQFGDPTWRRTFSDGNRLTVYHPIGAQTWINSRVEIEEVTNG
jgi:hypothetical protein